MDPITQGALGAVAAVSVASARNVRLATLVGWAGGMLADADVFIRSESDPLLAIEYHRHFTHSLIFIPVGGLICAAFFWLFLRRHLSFGALYLYSTLGYATAGVLDACTTYGTQLLWPFSDARIAWNIISIIDPIFTGVLLFLIAWGLVKRVPWTSRFGLIFAMAYLAFGAVQNHQATEAVAALAESRGHHDAERITAKPTIGNLAVWRGMYEHDGYFYVDAIRVSYIGSDIKVYEGERTPAVDFEELQEQVPGDSALAHDLERFEHFSDGYLTWHPEQPDVLADARYALLPNSVDPLWGIRVDTDSPERHAPFLTFRSADRRQVGRLWTMISGGELQED